jgi:hypothetical protein
MAKKRATLSRSGLKEKQRMYSLVYARVLACPRVIVACCCHIAATGESRGLQQGAALRNALFPFFLITNGYNGSPAACACKKELLDGFSGMTNWIPAR